MKMFFLALLCPLVLGACNGSGDISRDGDADRANVEDRAPVAGGSNDGAAHGMDRPEITDSMQAVGEARNGNGVPLGEEAGAHEQSVSPGKKNN